MVVFIVYVRTYIYIYVCIPKNIQNFKPYIRLYIPNQRTWIILTEINLDRIIVCNFVHLSLWLLFDDIRNMAIR